MLEAVLVTLLVVLVITYFTTGRFFSRARGSNTALAVLVIGVALLPSGNPPEWILGGFAIGFALVALVISLGVD